MQQYDLKQKRFILNSWILNLTSCLKKYLHDFCFVTTPFLSHLAKRIIPAELGVTPSASMTTLCLICSRAGFQDEDACGYLIYTAAVKHSFMSHMISVIDIKHYWSFNFENMVIIQGAWFCNHLMPVFKGKLKLKLWPSIKYDLL